MPLWKIYHPEGAFSFDDKHKISQELADVYGRNMPRFYVGVVFQAVAEDSFFIGGEPHPKFVRIWVDHIARTFGSAEMKVRFLTRMNAIFEPYTTARGLDWELHVDETPFDQWTVQGFFPPPDGSPDDLRWREENKPSPRTHP